MEESTPSPTTNNAETLTLPNLSGALSKSKNTDENASLNEIVELLKIKVHTLKNRVEILETNTNEVSQRINSLLEQELDDLHPYNRHTS